MQVKRLTLTAGAETEFTFDSFDAISVVVKNSTAGDILFCDGPFVEADAARIPAYSWQALNVRVHPDRTPSFYVKAAVAGDVEINFGSSGMGVYNIRAAFDEAGLVPHTLTFAAGADTTLAATLVRLHGESVDLDTPVSLTTGATVFVGDVITFAAASTDEHATPALTVNGAELELADGEAAYTVSGDIAAETEAVPIEYTLTLTVGGDTTLTAALIRERGAEEDLAEPVPLATGATIYAESIIQFTATCTAELHHATLTVNDTPLVLTEDIANHTVDGDTTAVTASVEDQEGIWIVLKNSRC